MARNYTRGGGRGVGVEIAASGVGTALITENEVNFDSIKVTGWVG